ncbi:TIGR03643 family protein [Thiosulfatimonas sediminis]|uniref:TIGR03643 family protein n=1 Tax=Thiosulfatimonas sediminis TaxID=2675054 RepID=A0A6F8PY56_9GAMM|nr:TIGR03643 family protein [Thiosulfatimonas sediminis]BBP46928.1 TIGR03643 family protein [Thiosulfatimonas sediminis]
MEKLPLELDAQSISRIIEMAWEDRTPFEAIEINYGLNESKVIKLMRRELKPSSFKIWRERVSGRKTKHLSLRDKAVSRGYCATQYKIRRGW